MLNSAATPTAITLFFIIAMTPIKEKRNANIQDKALRTNPERARRMLAQARMRQQTFRIFFTVCVWCFTNFAMPNTARRQRIAAASLIPSRV
nr:hypothetical protein [uncultured Ottowia sp.]